MKHYLGKIDTHICNSVINECMQHTVIPYKGNRDLDPTHKYYLDHLEQKQLADKSGYTDGDSVEFFHYKPGHEYSDDIHTIINDTIGGKVLQSFISEIRQGKCAPWHWDIPSLDESRDVVQDYNSDDLIRGICFISTPKPGQAFMVEDECFYMEPQGSIYRYPSVSSWHAGFNAGLETKFLLTFTALVSST